MLFSSYAFIFLFLPCFLIAWQVVAHVRPNWSPVILLVFSLVFYAFWGLPFLLLLLAMIAINYGFGRSIAILVPPWRKRLLLLAIAVNLLPLLCFKYSHFLAANLAIILHADWPFTPPELPLGISFYTFIQIAWLVGIYRGNFMPDKLERHTLFSCCFPYVISGPIVRYEQIGWQFDCLGALAAANLAAGFTLFTFGLAKKAILADSIATYANAVFAAASKGWPLAGAEAWLGSFCYTFQLYFDFSGYTDMAIGLGLMVGLKLPANFNSPYKATGIVDFWHRWHITLSSWLRDFLYIPLGGNRRGKLRQYLNLFLTMLIGGAWHGAGWTFFIWGALHGLMLCINHFFRIVCKNSPLAGMGRFLPLRLFSILLTFFCLNLCWVVFRAPSLDAAAVMFEAMFGWIFRSTTMTAGAGALMPNGYLPGWQPLALLCLCAGICWFCPNTQTILGGQGGILRWRLTSVWAVGMAMLAFASILMLTRETTFLYFQF